MWANRALRTRVLVRLRDENSLESARKMALALPS